MMTEMFIYIAVTILAFVYVPLNLATSIFGMNLSELNGSGKNLWVFLTTAVVALVITATTWFLIEEVNLYLIWRRNARHQYISTNGIGIAAWLFKSKRKGWMTTSDFWSRPMDD